MAIAVVSMVSLRIAIGVVAIAVNVGGGVKVEIVSAVIVGHHRRRSLKNHFRIKLMVIEHPLALHVLAVAISVPIGDGAIAIAAGASGFGRAAKFQTVAV